MAFTCSDLDALLLNPDPAVALRGSWDKVATAIPELGALDMDRAVRGREVHKDNVVHTILVTAKVPARRRIRLAALFHDVGKPPTRVINPDNTVTFHNHESVGGKLTKKALQRLGYDKELAYQVSEIVRLSGSTKGSELWSESAVRRFSLEAGELLGDILDFANEDVTSRHEWKHELVRKEVSQLRERLTQVAEKDEKAKWRPVVSGDEIMARYGLSPSREVGELLGLVGSSQRAAEAAGEAFDVDSAWEILDIARG
jgi:poly(A) polymerase